MVKVVALKRDVSGVRPEYVDGVRVSVRLTVCQFSERKVVPVEVSGSSVPIGTPQESR